MRDDAQARGDGINAPVAFTVLVLGGVLTFVLVVLLQALFYRVDERQLERKAGQGVPAERQAVTDEQQARLEEYRWLDRDAGVVAIPVDRAVELMIEERAPDRGGRP